MIYPGDFVTVSVRRPKLRETRVLDVPEPKKPAKQPAPTSLNKSLYEAITTD